MNILFKIGILFFLENYVSEWSEYTKYISTDLKFAIYRSLCCLFLFLYATVNVLFEPKLALLHILSYSSPAVIDLNLWFLSYAIVDIIFMIFYKINRIDLWLHHIMFIIGVIIYYKIFVVNLILLGEALSLFSAIDLYYIQNNMMYKSYLCKKIRKSVILYLRYPVWFYLLFYGLFQLIFLGIGGYSWGSVTFIPCCIALDFLWLKKCQKVINKYEKNK
ncbi:hypothetical protein CPAV1605_909 [seawater metagenome]|uniref:TLC domain-containing protein n=1 Tax=seawater metagenome TaxID=1561972 RepID=A0A5E8CKG4_9ZZZZ